MSKNSVGSMAIGVLASAGVLAVVSAVVEASLCLAPGATCRLGVDMTPVEAAIRLAGGLMIGGVAALGVIALPIGAILARRSKLNHWSSSLLGGISALVPVLTLCLIAGISPAQCIFMPGPGMPILIGGLFAGVVLWFTVLRHLTTRWSGP